MVVCHVISACSKSLVRILIYAALRRECYRWDYPLPLAGVLYASSI